MITRLETSVELHEVSIADAYAWWTDERPLPTSEAAAMLEIARSLEKEKQRAVDQAAPPNRWVRTANIHAMTMLIREPIYVIEELKDSETAVRCYSYKTLQTRRGGEHAQTKLLPPGEAVTLFSELRKHKVPPVVLILTHDKAGGHFTAVTYPPQVFDQETKNTRKLDLARSKILCSLGYTCGDPVALHVAEVERAALRCMIRLEQRAGVQIQYPDRTGAALHQSSGTTTTTQEVYDEWRDHNLGRANYLASIVTDAQITQLAGMIESDAHELRSLMMTIPDPVKMLAVLPLEKVIGSSYSVRSFCSEWLQSTSTDIYTTNRKLAGAPQRWSRLCKNQKTASTERNLLTWRKHNGMCSM